MESHTHASVFGLLFPWPWDFHWFGSLPFFTVMILSISLPFFSISKTEHSTVYFENTSKHTYG